MSDSENPSGESTAELVSEFSQEKWELMERVAELETKLAGREERDRIRELELAALRHELELRFAYNSSLERALEEQRMFATERARAERAEQALAAERARISYRLVSRVTEPLGQIARRLR
jgi:hypothetical protein